jgi:Na+/proline symporter
MLGGLSWFSVPWAFASCLGLAARALLTDVCIRRRFLLLRVTTETLQPNFPTYPNALSASQASAGLAAPAAAATMMGSAGAVAILLVVLCTLLFFLLLTVPNSKNLSMAVTSAASAELIAVSSILCVRLIVGALLSHSLRPR